MYLPIPVVVGRSRRPPVVGSRTSWNPTGGTGRGNGTKGSIGMGAAKQKEFSLLIKPADAIYTYT